MSREEFEDEWEEEFEDDEEWDEWQDHERDDLDELDEHDIFYFPFDALPEPSENEKPEE